MLAPSAARRVAIPRPIPDVEPVTSAVRPLSMATSSECASVGDRRDLLTRSAALEHLSRPRAGRSAVAPDDGAVDDHGLDALRRLDRRAEARALVDLAGVEDGDVRGHAGLQHAAIGEADIACGVVGTL